MIFAQYLDKHLKDFDATCSEVRQNGYKSDGLTYSGSYQPKSIKIDLNLWMIQCNHIYLLFIIISDPFFSETALTIFIKLCTMFDIDKRKKVTKPDYPKKFWIIQKVQKCGQNDSFLTFSQKWL